jgi:hypothetical protein
MTASFWLLALPGAALVLVELLELWLVRRQAR